MILIGNRAFKSFFIKAIILLVLLSFLSSCSNTKYLFELEGVKLELIGRESISSELGNVHIFTVGKDEYTFDGAVYYNGKKISNFKSQGFQPIALFGKNKKMILACKDYFHEDHWLFCEVSTKGLKEIPFVEIPVGFVLNIDSKSDVTKINIASMALMKSIFDSDSKNVKVIFDYLSEQYPMWYIKKLKTNRRNYFGYVRDKSISRRYLIQEYNDMYFKTFYDQIQKYDFYIGDGYDDEFLGRHSYAVEIRDFYWLCSDKKIMEEFIDFVKEEYSVYYDKFMESFKEEILNNSYEKVQYSFTKGDYGTATAVGWNKNHWKDDDTGLSFD